MCQRGLAPYWPQLSYCLSIQTRTRAYFMKGKCLLLCKGGQATAWEGSPGRSLCLTKSSACGRPFYCFPLFLCIDCWLRLLSKCTMNWVAQTTDNNFPTALEAGSLILRCWQVWFLPRLVSLASHGCPPAESPHMTFSLLLPDGFLFS